MWVLIIFSYKQVFTSRLENIMDPDQLASEEPAVLDLHCFQNTGYIQVSHG